MKYTSLKAFENHLCEAAPLHLSSLYMVLTSEPFLRKSIAEKITHLLNQDGKLIQKSFYEEEPLYSELASYNLFAKKQAFLLHNVEKLPKTSQEKLVTHFRNVPALTHLILLGSSISAQSTFYKQAEKIGVILDLPEEKPWEKEKTLQAWALEVALANGKKMAPQVASALIKQLGVDQVLLLNELQKLFCYVGSRSEISMQDIFSISSSKNVESIWQLGEALFKKQALRALKIAKEMLADGVALISLLRQIRSQYQTELQIGFILAKGGSSNDVVQQFPYMRGAILEGHLHNARTLGVKKLKEGLIHIDTAELKAKNSSTDPEILIELLIVHLTSP